MKTCLVRKNKIKGHVKACPYCGYKEVSVDLYTESNEPRWTINVNCVHCEASINIDSNALLIDEDKLIKISRKMWNSDDVFITHENVSMKRKDFKTKIRISLKSKKQLPLFMITKEYYEKGELVFGKVIFEIKGRKFKKLLKNPKSIKEGYKI